MVGFCRVSCVGGWKNNADVSGESVLFAVDHAGLYEINAGGLLLNYTRIVI